MKRTLTLLATVAAALLLTVSPAQAGTRIGAPFHDTAAVSTTVDEPGNTTTIAWLEPNGGTTQATATWPQFNIGLPSPYCTPTGTQTWQVDVYDDSTPAKRARVTYLEQLRYLLKPGSSPASDTDSDVVLSWTFVTPPACAVPTTAPTTESSPPWTSPSESSSSPSSSSPSSTPSTTSPSASSSDTSPPPSSTTPTTPTSSPTDVSDSSTPSSSSAPSSPSSPTSAPSTPVSSSTVVSSTSSPSTSLPAPSTTSSSSSPSTPLSTLTIPPSTSSTTTSSATRSSGSASSTASPTVSTRPTSRSSASSSRRPTATSSPATSRVTTPGSRTSDNVPPASLTQGGDTSTTATLKAAPLAYTGSGINPRLWVSIAGILLLLGVIAVTYPGRRRQGGHR